MRYDDDATRAWVFIEDLTPIDSPFFVAGWHYKEFPITVPGMEALKQVGDAILWPRVKEGGDTDVEGFQREEDAKMDAVMERAERMIRHGSRHPE